MNTELNQQSRDYTIAKIECALINQNAIDKSTAITLKDLAELIGVYPASAHAYIERYPDSIESEIRSGKRGGRVRWCWLAA